jgi:hypothetical protein
MKARLKQAIDTLKEAAPGERFEGVYDRAHVRNYALRIAFIIVGLLLMVASAVTFWLPGPNFVLVLAGLAIIGGQSQFVARTMDRIEVAGRRWHTETWLPYPHKHALVGTLAAVAIALIALAAWYAWHRGWVPVLQ